ncbi:hypothetical protein [Bartonella sp. WD16.2]|uniref:hypothetical protein n=1 Tax=Bartonella sp. WD16.2 TaxID=1933904 RepID=UPI000999EFEC|nr:hypothetical protein [Bartonella sp. WD16.2]AQX19786.1 hypothetical protein BWD162_006640 [Bartonella sp. WD16.2]
MSRFYALDPSLDQEDGRNNKGMMSLARRMPFRDLVRYSLSVPIHLLDKNVWPKKIDFPDLIRGYYKEPEETGKKGLKDLIVSVADLKDQMAPLSDYSIKTNNTPQYDKSNSLGHGESLISQSEFVSPIDMPSQNEAEQQQKDAMNYIAELNRRSAREQLQTNAPLNENAPLSEEGALQTNDKSEQEQESLNAPENFINSQGQPEQLANSEADDFFQRLAGVMAMRGFKTKTVRVLYGIVLRIRSFQSV